MRFEAGTRLGPYEITGPIGAGGMGEVYRARDTRLGREVAIKVLPHDLLGDPQRLARFEREARSASALNHRNIVTIHDFTSRDGEAWLVMELIRGESLRDMLMRGPLPLKKLLSIGAGITEGLAAAHGAGIVHRDLKPENVMIAGDGTPKILDFGLVKAAAPLTDEHSPTDRRVTSSGVIMGTAAYMSPEQARGEEVDSRTDQFSLGLILHEMATGKHPFARPSGLETLNAILNAEPEPLGESYPEAFVEIVERCLSKNPQERYGATSDLAHDIRRVGERGARHTAAPGTTARRTWWPFAAAALAIAVVAAIARWPKKEIGLTEPLQAAVATPEIAHVIRDEVAQPVALSPDGRFVVIYGMDAEGISGLWLHDLRSGATRQLAQKTFSAGWSADSKAIAFFGDGKLKTVPVDGGPPRDVCDARPEGAATWHGDNILYVQYSTEKPGIYRVSASGGPPERIVAPEKGQLGKPWSPEFLPDGRHFLYLVLLLSGKQDIGHELYVGSLDGGAPRRVTSTIHSRAIFANGHLLFVRDGTLLAQPFDPEKARLTGEPRPVVDGLHYFRSTGAAAFSASQNGVLAWRAVRRSSRLVWLDRAGLERKAADSARFNPDGRLSPDGRRYAVSIMDTKQGVSDLWIYDFDRESSQRLTFTLFDERAPVWAPDGRAIFYRSDGGGGPPDIFKLYPGEERASVVYHGPGVEEPHDVSADGKSLLFIDFRQAAASDINVLSLTDPPTAKPFVATPFNEMAPRFSPDGRWVAYQSDISGRPEVYVRRFEGPAQATRISKDGGTRPRWRRDGKELFFLAPGGRVMALSISDGQPSTGAPRILFQAVEAVDFEPAADGSRFLLQLEEGSSDPPVHLLINWPARLPRER